MIYFAILDKNMEFKTMEQSPKWNNYINNNQPSLLNPNEYQLFSQLEYQDQYKSQLQLQSQFI